MADDRKTQDRPVQRAFECHRLEQQLCSLAYEELWPVIRKRTRAAGSKRQRPYPWTRTAPLGARSA
jgi:hypothetical protein